MRKSYLEKIYLELRGKMKNWKPVYPEYSSKDIREEIANELMPFINHVVGQKERFGNSQLKHDYIYFKEKYKRAKDLKDFLLVGVAPEWNDPEIYEQGVKFAVGNMFAYLGLIER